MNVTILETTYTNNSGYDINAFTFFFGINTCTEDTVWWDFMSHGQTKWVYKTRETAWSSRTFGSNSDPY